MIFALIMDIKNHIIGVIVCVLVLSGVDCWFNALTDQTKIGEIDICCFSTKHVALRSKNKDWLARHQDNVSEWGNMSNHGLLFQGTSTIKNQLRVFLVPR